MPINIRWYNDEKTILLEELSGTYTLDDYIALIDEAREHVMSCDHTVDIIGDFTGTNHRKLPHYLMSAARYADKQVPPNQGIAVFVNPGMFIETILRMARQLQIQAADEVVVAKTVDEAVEIIEQEQAKRELSPT